MVTPSPPCSRVRGGTLSRRATSRRAAAPRFSAPPSRAVDQEGVGSLAKGEAVEEGVDLGQRVVNVHPPHVEGVVGVCR